MLQPPNAAMRLPPRVAFLLFPHLTQLDLTGPAQVFAAAGCDVRYVWRDKQPVPSDAGLWLCPTDTFDSCPPCDVLCVPGGPGQGRWMEDAAVLGWLKGQGSTAAWVTSVCSGSLLLGAAGLLGGYKAASHWNYREYLGLFGAIPDTARVVRDRNRITGGGVTAGIDMALTVLSEALGANEAQQAQLLLEYAPEPPFDHGRPEFCSEATVAAVKVRLKAQQEAAERAQA